MSDPKYSQDELNAILHKAAERSTADEERYTLAEIQQIASEADIAPEHVAQAAAALTVAPASAPSVLWGAASGVQLVRKVNRRASPNEVMDALALARQHLGQTGESRDAGGAVEWRYNTGYSRATVSILADESGTVVRVEGRADGRQFILHFGAVAAAVLTGFIASATATPTFSALPAAVALVPFVGGARWLWNRSARAMQHKLTNLADELARKLGR